jgi:chemotaxis protein methyltransferase CheR
MSTLNTITTTDYERFKNFLEQACGILLGNGKEYLIISRMTELLRDENIASYDELLRVVILTICDA